MKTLALMCIALTSTSPSYAALPDDLRDAVRDVDELHARLRLEPEILGERFHGTYDSATFKEPVMRATVVLAFAAGALAGTVLAQEPATPAVVKSSRFELVDSSGRTRAVLGMSKGGAPELDLRDPEGRPRALLVLDAENLPVFLLKDADVITRAKLELDAKGQAKLSFLDAALNPRIEVDASVPELKLSDSKKEKRLRIEN
jgi:hypothetical protein